REAMFLGMATDTGWFRFSNTNAELLQTVADLVRDGVDPHLVHQGLFQHDRAARIRLLGRAINSLELMEQERLACMTLTPEDYKACNADAGDTENIVNEPLKIGTVSASVILVDRGEGLIRCSFRSKPPEKEGQPDLDVSAVAFSLGGGGHRRAAAARIPGEMASVKPRVLDALRKIM
ncbi:MAG: DHH family phosphoesterase, partial [Phycisphaerae bacterium]